jgi:transposase
MEQHHWVKFVPELTRRDTQTFCRKICSQTTVAGRGWIFQQDNASIDTSNHSMAWFNRNKVRMLGWPAKSPDLNPMENLWDIMARQVYGHGKQYETKRDLKAAIIYAWNQLSLELLQTLISSMKNRIFKTICGNGSFTK